MRAKPNRELNQLVHSHELEWRPLDEPGVTGVSVKVLRFDPATGRAPTILLRFEPGATYPAHNHPGGEEIFVLEGDIRLGKDHLQAGDYIYTAPNNVHAVRSDRGCVVLVVIPEEVEKLHWSLKWGADTIMDLSTGGDLDACREAIITESTAPIGTVPIYSMIIGRKLEDLNEQIVFGFYGLLLALTVFASFRRFLQTPFVLLGIGVALFAVAVLVDAVPAGTMVLPPGLEDSLELVGTCFWSAYFVKCSRDVLVEGRPALR